VILALIRMGDTTAIEDGEQIYKEYVLANNYSLNALDPDLITSILSAALATNKSDYFDQITNVIYNTVDSSQQDYILSSLGALYKNSALINQATEFVLSDKVRNNAKTHGLYACRACSGRFAVWTELTANNGMAWDNLAAIFQSGFEMSDLTAVFNTFASDTMLADVQNFYSVNGRTTGANARVVNQTVEGINARELWLADNRQAVQQFLTDIGDYPTYKDGNDSGSDKSEWYKQWWFYLLIAIVCVLILGVIGRVVYRRQAKAHVPGDYFEIHEL